MSVIYAEFSWLSNHSTRFDLENPADVARLADPMLALQDLKGLVVLDEVQRRPGVVPGIARVGGSQARSRAFSGFGQRGAGSSQAKL
jgi:hypothetical protein